MGRIIRAGMSIGWTIGAHSHGFSQLSVKTKTQSVSYDGFASLAPDTNVSPRSSSDTPFSPPLRSAPKPHAGN